MIKCLEMNYSGIFKAEEFFFLDHVQVHIYRLGTNNRRLEKTAYGEVHDLTAAQWGAS
jgi:hypothetical protein